MAEFTGHAAEGKIFLRFLSAQREPQSGVIFGAFLNALGILIGAICGLAKRHPISARTQAFFKSALGALTVIYGLHLIYDDVSGSFLDCARQVLIGMLAVVIGYWVGKLLRLQTLSNRVGHHAAALLTAAQKNPPGSSASGFVAVTLLFCAAPLGILGAVADGVQGYFYLLLLKGVMDGLAMLSFVKMFRWTVALAAMPVFFFFNGLSLMIHLAQPWLAGHGLIGYVGVAAGWVTCSVALVIFEVRRVELANYLPAVVVAPVLGHWLG